MSEEKKSTTTTDSKLSSRKFIVWLVWLIITILVIAWCALVMIITKQIQDQLVGLLEKVLYWFFAISMMYLGVNAGQKGALAFADALKNKHYSKEEEDE